MSGTQPKTAFGRIFPLREAWLAKAPPEPIIDPELPIVDTHHTSGSGAAAALAANRGRCRNSLPA